MLTEKITAFLNAVNEIQEEIIQAESRIARKITETKRDTEFMELFAINKISYEQISTLKIPIFIEEHSYSYLTRFLKNHSKNSFQKQQKWKTFSEYKEEIQKDAKEHFRIPVYGTMLNPALNIHFRFLVGIDEIENLDIKEKIRNIFNLEIELRKARDNRRKEEIRVVELEQKLQKVQLGS